jgi:ABC-type phosphate/phosphonate transport system substrate-binding protein
VLASLPMYDLVETRSATDGFWAAVAQAYGTQGKLTRDDDWQALWRNPALGFSQTCGYPFTHEFAGTLSYVATPHYAADGCDGPYYSSILFARTHTPLAHFENQIAAYNSNDSASGMLALQLVFAPLAQRGKFFRQAMQTGSHVGSLAAVQQGQADICAIDCVTVALLKIYRPTALAGLVDVGRSPLLPGLPYVTRSADVNVLRTALALVFANAHVAPLRKALLLSGYSILPATAYDNILTHEQSMQRSGGLQLRDL